MRKVWPASKILPSKSVYLSDPRTIFCTLGHYVECKIVTVKYSIKKGVARKT